MKCGFVSIVGRPNVGKSTLLNEILESKLAITSNKAGTTRNIIEGVYEDSDSQIVFIDTPGIHKPTSNFSSILNKKAYSTKDSADVILFMVDSESGIGKGDKFILDTLKEEETPIFLLLNKVDKVKKDKLLKMIEEASNLYPFKEIFPISAIKGDNVKPLIETLKNYLPLDEKIFEDRFTNITTNFYISEIIREKVLNKTREEVPHSVTCYVENIEHKKENVVIQAVIVVDKKSVKKIIVGHNASMLKQIGIEARIDLEEYFNKKVYLSLFVKVIENWKEKENYLKEFNIIEE